MDDLNSEVFQGFFAFLFNRPLGETTLIITFSLGLCLLFNIFLYIRPLRTRLKDSVEKETAPLRENVNDLKALLHRKNEEIQSLKDKNHQLELEKLSHFNSNEINKAKLEMMSHIKEYSKGE